VSTAHFPAGVRLIVPANPDPLLQRAQRNYPDSDYLQREWLRAVRVVRSTSGGWRLDNPAGRVKP
jgi:hypothetical protein